MTTAQGSPWSKAAWNRAVRDVQAVEAFQLQQLTEKRFREHGHFIVPRRQERFRAHVPIPWNEGTFQAVGLRNQSKTKDDHVLSEFITDNLAWTEFDVVHKAWRAYHVDDDKKENLGLFRTRAAATDECRARRELFNELKERPGEKTELQVSDAVPPVPLGTKGFEGTVENDATYSARKQLEKYRGLRELGYRQASMFSPGTFELEDSPRSVTGYDIGIGARPSEASLHLLQPQPHSFPSLRPGSPDGDDDCDSDEDSAGPRFLHDDYSRPLTTSPGNPRYDRQAYIKPPGRFASVPPDLPRARVAPAAAGPPSSTPPPQPYVPPEPRIGPFCTPAARHVPAQPLRSPPHEPWQAPVVRSLPPYQRPFASASSPFAAPRKHVAARPGAVGGGAAEPYVPPEPCSAESVRHGDSSDRSSRQACTPEAEDPDTGRGSKTERPASGTRDQYREVATWDAALRQVRAAVRGNKALGAARADALELLATVVSGVARTPELRRTAVAHRRASAADLCRMQQTAAMHNTALQIQDKFESAFSIVAKRDNKWQAKRQNDEDYGVGSHLAGEEEGASGHEVEDYSLIDDSATLEQDVAALMADYDQWEEHQADEALAARIRELNERLKG